MLQTILSNMRDALILGGRLSQSCQVSAEMFGLSATVECGIGPYMLRGGSRKVLAKIVSLAEEQASYVLRRG